MRTKTSSQKLEIAFRSRPGQETMKCGQFWRLGIFDMQGRKQQFRLGVKGGIHHLLGIGCIITFVFWLIPIDQCMDFIYPIATLGTRSSVKGEI